MEKIVLKIKDRIRRRKRRREIDFTCRVRNINIIIFPTNIINKMKITANHKKNYLKSINKVKI